MKYKIQQNNPMLGFIDMKYTMDGGKTYKFDLFNTRQEAKLGLVQSLIEIDDLEGIDDYRIVKEDVEADYDINENNAKHAEISLERLKKVFENK
jgi:hypothetical protein